MAPASWMLLSAGCPTQLQWLNTITHSSAGLLGLHLGQHVCCRRHPVFLCMQVLAYTLACLLHGVHTKAAATARAAALLCGILTVGLLAPLPVAELQIRTNEGSCAPQELGRQHAAPTAAQQQRQQWQQRHQCYLCKELQDTHEFGFCNKTMRGS